MMYLAQAHFKRSHPATRRELPTRRRHRDTLTTTPYAPTRTSNQRVQRHKTPSRLSSLGHASTSGVRRGRGRRHSTRAQVCTAHTSCTRAEVSSAAPSLSAPPLATREYSQHARGSLPSAPSVLMARPSSEARHVQRRPSASSSPLLSFLGAGRSAPAARPLSASAIRRWRGVERIRRWRGGTAARGAARRVSHRRIPLRCLRCPWRRVGVSAPGHTFAWRPRAT